MAEVAPGITVVAVVLPHPVPLPSLRYGLHRFLQHPRSREIYKAGTRRRPPSARRGDIAVSAVDSGAGRPTSRVGSMIEVAATLAKSTPPQRQRLYGSLGVRIDFTLGASTLTALIGATGVGRIVSEGDSYRYPTVPRQRHVSAGCLTEARLPSRSRSGHVRCVPPSPAVHAFRTGSRTHRGSIPPSSTRLSSRLAWSEVYALTIDAEEGAKRARDDTWTRHARHVDDATQGESLTSVGPPSSRTP